MTNTTYSNPAKLLHWLVAGLIVSQYVLAKMAEHAREQDETLNQLALLANHKSVGITILALAIIRLLVRFASKPPTLPHSIPKWQRVASHTSHGLLYGFLFALPITGWLMSSAKAYSVSWFNLFALPDFVSPSESLAETLHAAHHYLAEALFVVALIHILAALKHHFIDKDDILKRMSGLGSWVIFAATGIIAILVLGRFFSGGSEPEIQQTHTQSASQFQASDLPIWNIDYTDSFIEFSGDQAGAAFTGEWQRWQADIQFDAKQLEKARFNVTIQPDSVFSNDKERDEHIRSSDFFDVAAFAEATFQADQFKVTEQGFDAVGQLQMKSVSSTAVLHFKVEQVDDKQVLSGSATLDRLIWNIGSGDWKDTSWVGQEVVVEVRVVATDPQ